MSTPNASTPVISPAWLPPGETGVELFNERTLLDGAIMTGVVYGIHFTIFVQCAYLLLKDLRKKRTNRFFLAYVVVMFILGTLFVASSSRVAQMTFVDDRNYPGGPVGWAQAAFSIPVNLLGNVTFTIANWMADALMIWRCYIIWSGRIVWLIVTIPCLLWLVSFIMGILLLTEVAQPGLNIWSNSSVNFALAYFSVSLTLNILVTLLILVRLLQYRREVSKTLGKAYARYYTSVAAMLVESASLYAACSLLFLVPYVLNHPLQNIFMQVLSQVQIIAPLLVIFRVASGHGVTSSALTTDARVTFATDPSTDRPSNRSDSTRARTTDLSTVSRGDLVVHFDMDTRSEGYSHSESMLTPIQDKLGDIAEKIVEVKEEP